MSYKNNHLGIKLSVSDYANAANNTFTVAETKFDAFNTLTNITVNGTALADLWTDSGSGDVAFMQMFMQPGLWIPIVAPAEGAEVVIPAGTVFPSYSAVSGGTAYTYVTTSKITY